MNILNKVIPTWVRWVVLAMAGTALFFMGQIRGERIAGQDHIDYVNARAAQGIKIVRAQAEVVIKTETVYRDRIQKIYVQGDVIEKEVPVYVTQADSDRCTVNTGFVRSQNAAWTGEPVGGAADSDREDSGISLTEVAETDAFNAKACLAWREHVIGWRDFYARMKAATNQTK